MGTKPALAAIVLFFALMAGLTVYAQRRYTAMLPQVELGPAQGAGTFNLTVPASAVFSDDTDTYLWLVSEIQGPWGKEYVVEKGYVSVLRAEGDRVYLAGQARKPIVIAADRPLLPGQAVRFVRPAQPLV